VHCEGDALDSERFAAPQTREATEGATAATAGDLDFQIGIAVARGAALSP
jgi:hypothetical protein